MGLKGTSVANPFIFGMFVASGDNGKELWWQCAFSNCWEEYFAGDDQNCEEEGELSLYMVGYSLSIRCLVVFDLLKELVSLYDSSSWLIDS